MRAKYLVINSSDRTTGDENNFFISLTNCNLNKIVQVKLLSAIIPYNADMADEEYVYIRSHELGLPVIEATGESATFVIRNDSTSTLRYEPNTEFEQTIEYNPPTSIPYLNISLIKLPIADTPLITMSANWSFILEIKYAEN